MTLLVNGAVTRAWTGKTVVCIASGPSTSKEQLDLVRDARESDRVRAITVNDMYLVAPWADVLYFADHKWWTWHKGGVERAWPWVKFSKAEVSAAFRDFRGQKVTIRHAPMATDPDITVLENDQHNGSGMSETPNAIRTGGNSGYQALNIAALSGGNPVLLVGYDMRHVGARSHSHSGHGRDTSVDDVYRGYAKRYATAENDLKRMGVTVYNCTAGSTINSFEFKTLEDCLCLCLDEPT